MIVDFEVCVDYYFYYKLLFFVFVFVVGFVWMLLMVSGVSKKMFWFFISLLLLVVHGFFLCSGSEGLLGLISFSLFLGFMSLFFVLSYGVSTEGSSLVLSIFKFVPDVCFCLVLGVFCLFEYYLDLKVLNVVSLFVGKYLILFVFGLLFYSVLFVFGFWIYWGMEASHFASFYLHSCGLVSVGVCLYYVLLGYGCFETSWVSWVVCLFSLLSFVFYMVLFLTVSNLKSALGFFSASSVCFIFVLMLINPSSGLVYFFLSSVFKIGLFYLVEKSKDSDLQSKDLLVVCVFLGVFGFSVYYVFFPFCVFDFVGVSTILLGFFGCSLFSDFLCIIFSLKVGCLMLFLFKVKGMSKKSQDFNIYYLYLVLFMLLGFYGGILYILVFVWGLDYHFYLFVFVCLSLFVLFLCSSFFDNWIVCFEAGLSKSLNKGFEMVWDLFWKGLKALEGEDFSFYLMKVFSYKVFSFRLSVDVLWFVLVFFCLFVLFVYF